MKKIVLYAVGLILIIIAFFYVKNYMEESKERKAHEEWLSSIEPTASDHVSILKDTITIDYLDEKRTLAIYLPEGYDTDSVDYPVLYFLDGESLFDQKIQEGMEWEIDETMDSLNQYKCIVVGIYSSDDRMKEYKPFPSTRWYSDWTVSGDQHAEWIVESVKPWIDSSLRTKKEAASTYIGGASLGGLMSYFMLMEYPEVFGGAYVLSPSYWVNEIVYTLHEKNDKFRGQKIYFNAGELETPTVDGIVKMKEILMKAGMPEENIRLDVEKELGHWHITWRDGFRKAYPWMMEGS